MAIERITGVTASLIEPKDHSKLHTVREGEKPPPENEDELIIEVKIPKPEAMIFSNRMDTHYRTLPTEKSFIPEILENGKKLK